MRAFAEVAARFGSIDPEDESQVQRFFEDEAPALPPTEQAEILDALLELEGTALAPLKDRKPASGPSEILLEDSPSLALPATEVDLEQQAFKVSEMAGAIALAFNSLFYTAGLDVRVSMAVEDRSVQLSLGGPDAERLDAEDKPLLVTMERLAEVLAERNEAIDRVTLRLSIGSAGFGSRQTAKAGSG
jgi:predicted RNA-binding protein Jag